MRRVSARLIEHVACAEMPEVPIELGHVDIGDTLAAANQQHVLIVGRKRCLREVGRSRAHQRVIRQRIDEQHLRVNEVHMSMVGGPGQFLFDKPLVEVRVRNGRDLCAAKVALYLDEGLAEDRAVRERQLAAIELLGGIHLCGREVLENYHAHRAVLPGERLEDGIRDIEWNGHHRERGDIGNSLPVPVQHVGGDARREERRDRQRIEHVGGVGRECCGTRESTLADRVVLQHFPVV